MQSASPSQTRTLLERVDITDDAALGQFVEEWGGRSVSLSVIYRHFLQGPGLNPGATFSPVSERVIEEQEDATWRIIGNSMTELKADDILLASAFVLAFGEGAFQFKEHAGIRYIKSTRHVRVTAEHLKSLSTFFELSVDKVVYKSDCDKKTLPKGFVNHRLKPYLKEQWNKWEDADRSIVIQDQDESFQVDDDDEIMHQDDSLHVLPEEDAELDSVHELIEGLTWLDEEIDRLFDQYGIDNNNDESLTPEKFIRVKHELRQVFMCHLTSVDSGHATGVSGEENDRVDRDAMINLDPNFQEYLYEKLKLQEEPLYDKIRRFVDDVIQCWARNKRIVVFNVIDMLIGALVSFLIVNLLIAGIIYIASAAATLLTLRLIMFVWHSVMEAIHKSKIQVLQNNIEAVESTIEEQSERLKVMREANVPDDNQDMVEAQRILDQSEKELHQHKCQLLGRKAYLAEKMNITDALISERREFDRITNEVEVSKGQLDGSLDAEIRYAKKMAKLKKQEDRLIAAMEPVSKTISCAYEAYTYSKSKIEKDLQIILDADSPFFGEGIGQEGSRDEDLWSNVIQKKGEFETQSTGRKIWRFLTGPTLIQKMVEEELHDNDQDERTMLARLCSEMQEMTPENPILIQARNLEDAVYQFKQKYPERSVRQCSIACECDDRIKAEKSSNELGLVSSASTEEVQSEEARVPVVSEIHLPGSSADMENNQDHDLHDFFIMERRGNKDYRFNVNLLLSDWLGRVRNGISINQVAQTQSQRLNRAHILGGLKESWDTFLDFLSYYFRRSLYRWHEAGLTTVFVSGTSAVSAVSVVKATFPNPGATGGLGIVLWFCFRHFAYWLDRKNDRINKGLTEARERIMASYDASSDVADEAGAVIDTGRKEQTPATENRTSEGTGYFNLGVLSDHAIAQLSEDEWRALRRQTKHTIQEIKPLIEALNEVQIQLERLIEGSRQSRDVTVADREKATCLLLRYTLLTRRIESTIKVPEQANYELVRHVHRINKRVRHVYTPNQKPMIPAVV